MDSAKDKSLQEFLPRSNSRMDHQEEQMAATGHAVQVLVAQVSELTNQLRHLTVPTAPASPPVSPAPTNTDRQHKPRLPTPEVYMGEPNYCRAFLTKCSLFFSLQPQTFATEQSKVAELDISWGSAQ